MTNGWTKGVQDVASLLLVNDFGFALLHSCISCCSEKIIAQSVEIDSNCFITQMVTR